MSAIRISGWQPGMRKISVTKFLQEEVGLGVREAKAMVDVVLEGREVEIDLAPGDDADAVTASIRELGAICEVRRD